MCDLNDELQLDHLFIILKSFLEKITLDLVE